MKDLFFGALLTFLIFKKQGLLFRVNCSFLMTDTGYRVLLLFVLEFPEVVVGVFHCWPQVFILFLLSHVVAHVLTYMLHFSWPLLNQLSQIRSNQPGTHLFYSN